MDATARRDDWQAPLSVDIRIPLVVDLDRTLILTDTLQEAFAKLLFSKPIRALASLGALFHSRAAFKAGIAEHGIPDVTCMPYRMPLVNLLRQEKARGRPIHLVTAADQIIADAVAAHLGLFDSATGSDGNQNLKGSHKLQYLRDRFADGFIYAGDHAADLPVFKAARGAILCDVKPRIAASARTDATVLVEMREPPRSVNVWPRVLRVHQWSKNLLIFVPLFVGHAYGHLTNVLTATAGFALLCLLASATYMLNDIADLDADRLHHTKRRRVFASGEMPVAFGLIATPLLIAVSLVGALLLSPAFAIALVVYLLLSLAYSFGVKQLPLVDVFVISTLFTLRIVMGTAVIGLHYSPWLLTFSCAFFLSLALAKRHVEVIRAFHIDVEDVIGRGYRGADWPLTLSFGVGSGLTSIVIMLLYLTNEAAPSGFYGNPSWLYAVPALMMIWSMRIWLLSNRMKLDDDPVIFALKDRTSLVLGLGVALAFLMAL